MKFPQYRKYKNNLSYFKIDSLERFSEWKKQPSGWEKVEFEAKILPDRVFISDMIQDKSPYWDTLSLEEFNYFTSTLL